VIPNARIGALPGADFGARTGKNWT